MRTVRRPFYTLLILGLLVGWGLIGVAIWLAMEWGYGRTIETLEATVQQKQATIAHMQTLPFLEQGVSPAVKPPVYESAPEGAYVFVERGNVYNLTEGGLQGYVVAINNDTERHARITDWRVGIAVSDTPPPFDLNEFGKMLQQEGIAIIRPRGTIPAYRTYGELTDADIQAVKSGVKRVYVFGEIKYDDATGADHATKFCHIYYGTETSPNFDGYEASQARYCGAPHNAAR